MNNPGPLDPVSALVALFTVLVGPALAQFLGAYAVIIIGAAVGSGMALLRCEPQARMSAATFMALMISLSSLVTVGFAELANLWLKLQSINWLIAPISLGIGAIGHDWPKVIKWAANKALTIFERKVDQ